MGGTPDINHVWVDAVMTTRPAITATTTIHDAATIMITANFRHLPVTGDTGLIGILDIIDICRALINARQE